MPRFEPFAGLRYDPTRVELARVTAPPYDVIDSQDRAELLERDPHNVVLVDLPQPSDGDDPYALAGAAFAQWRADDIVVTDSVPTFYAYRMEYPDETGRIRRTTGVIGALELAAPGVRDGDAQPILPHEFTTPKAKSDRLDLLRATHANLSAVWGLSPAVGLSELLGVDDLEPEASWSDDDGVTHSLWLLTDPDRLAAISTAVGSEPIVIADGHHRFETSLAYRDERRSSDNAGTAADAVMTYVVELSPDQLTVRPIHRLLAGLPAELDLTAALAPFFTLTDAGSVDATAIDRMVASGALMLVLPDQAWFMRPRPDAMTEARDLDSSRLDVALASLPPHELVFQHGVEHIVERIAKGEAQAGVLLRPATVDQIVAIAQGGERMPPKTTFFHPKPRTGVVFRDLG